MPTTQMSINRINEQIIIYSYNRLLLGNKKAKAKDTRNNVDESPKHCVERTKPNTKRVQTVRFHSHGVQKRVQIRTVISLMGLMEEGWGELPGVTEMLILNATVFIWGYAL